MTSTIPTIVRVYKGTVKTIKKADWRINQSGYYEIGYEEFDTETGELVSEGSADFSSARMRGELKRYDVQAYSGRRNRAGGRMTETIGVIFVSKNQKFPAIRAARLVYGENVARIERF